MMDNTTPLSAIEYDGNIEDIVPFYSEFYRQTIDLVKSFQLNKGKWLDVGCGTGALIAEAIKEFPLLRYVLCDPSEAMISLAKTNLSKYDDMLEFCSHGSQQLKFAHEFDIITAIQSHHYMQHESRRTAVNNCYDALKEEGVFIFFENFTPSSERSKTIVMDRWGRYQKSHGKSDTEINRHRQRYGIHYFPITLEEHFELLSDSGFKTIELFWLSYMQAGIYAIK